ncbi:apolipoprotein A-II [Halichoeres trimaculatus]|uniref:apolipoprotein A-II n=1 Tax=Halichoeres trimaculatus TaxID=147232 RepID=UPI003D9DE13D
MNAKYVVALILALQVSTSLCEIPQPSQELVDKYNDIKSTILRRIMGLQGRLQAAAGPMMENAGQNEHAQKAKDFVEALMSKPEFQSFIKVVGSLGSEASPAVEQIRLTALGLYEQYLRPYIGVQLDEAINNIKPILNKYAPAE